MLSCCPVRPLLHGRVLHCNAEQRIIFVCSSPQFGQHADTSSVETSCVQLSMHRTAPPSHAANESTPPESFTVDRMRLHSFSMSGTSGLSKVFATTQKSFSPVLGSVVVQPCCRKQKSRAHATVTKDKERIKRIHKKLSASIVMKLVVLIIGGIEHPLKTKSHK